MSKSTKVIAALGVAAGLGVAALPAATFAVESDTATVGLEVEVTDMITLTVTGTNAGDTNADAYVKTSMAPGEAVVKTGTAAVVTNNIGGYTLSVAPDAAGVLSNNETAPEADTIAPFGSAATYTDTSGDNAASFDKTGWGITFTNSGATIDSAINTDIAAGKYIGISSETTLLKTAASASPTTNTTNISYGFSTKDTQKTGTYTGKVTYTATNNE